MLKLTTDRSAANSTETANETFIRSALFRQLLSYRFGRRYSAKKILPMISTTLNHEINTEDELYLLLFNCFSFFLNWRYESRQITPPSATRIIPMRDEYPLAGTTVVVSEKISSSCFINNENFTTTKPKAITAIAVRIQARNVRSLARWSAAFPGRGVSASFISKAFELPQN